MSGTIIGGKRAAATNKAKHGEDFYKNIGRKGGKISKRGFSKEKIERIRRELEEDKGYLKRINW